jgi:hypothetical protein
MGKAGLVDKVIGKVEKVGSLSASPFNIVSHGRIRQVIGKVTHNADMHEAGELRESGGKEAVTGQARAPHD